MIKKKLLLGILIITSQAFNSVSSQNNVNNQELINLNGIKNTSQYYEPYLKALNTTSTTSPDSLSLVNKLAYTKYEQANYQLKTHISSTLKSCNAKATSILNKKREQAVLQANETSDSIRNSALLINNELEQLNMFWQSENWNSYANQVQVLYLLHYCNSDSMLNDSLALNSYKQQLQVAYDSIMSQLNYQKISLPDDEQLENEKNLRVVKGYSPFSNYTDTFYVEAPQSIELSDTLEGDYNNTTNINQEVYLDSLRKENIKNYLEQEANASDKEAFIDFLSNNGNAYTKTELMEAWDDFMTYKYEQFDSFKNKELASVKIPVTDNIKHTESHNTELTPTEEKTKQINSELTLLQDTDDQTIVTSTKINDDDTSDHTNSEAIQYYVQLAASRTALNTQQLLHLHTDTSRVHTRFEEGWYKYQVLAGYNYKEARTFTNSFDEQQVFLTAYRAQQKLNLWESIALSEQEEQIDQVMFVVQVAASRSTLSINEIQSLGNGSEQVRMIEEDDWHKYQIVIGESYQLALNKCKLIGLDKCFPVVYINDQKGTLQRAFEILKNRSK